MLGPGYKVLGRGRSFQVASRMALHLVSALSINPFWPMIRDLYWASTGKQPLDSQASAALAHRWILFDWIRTALIAVGFVASLLAMTRNADAYSDA